MKRFGLTALALAAAGSAASAANLNVSVTSGGSNNITVPPGCVVTYSVSGQLSDTNNEGLALVGFDLDFTGGALTQANVPTTVPMNNFVSPLGINNPPGAAGYGGTVIDGNLVQVGGGQNTIKNVVTNAPFPIGEVITGVAHTSVELVSGQLTAPANTGTYTLMALNVFANQIKDGETGNVFWKTEACGVGSISNLTINVQEGANCGGEVISIVSSVPPNNWIDARQPANLVGGCADAPGQNSIAITFDGPATGVVAGDFIVTTNPAGAAPAISNVAINGNTATLTLGSRIPVGRWTVFTHHHSGTSTRIGFLPGDVNNDKTSSPVDILKLIDHLNMVENYPIHQTDIDRSGVANPSDILREIDLLNGADCYDPWNNVSLPQ
jgi:hypothetical protein